MMASLIAIFSYDVFLQCQHPIWPVWLVLWPKWVRILWRAIWDVYRGGRHLQGDPHYLNVWLESNLLSYQNVHWIFGSSSSPRWARSVVGTMRTTLVIFTRNPATALKAVLASSSHRTRWVQAQDWSVVTQLEDLCGSCWTSVLIWYNISPPILVLQNHFPG